MKLGELLSELTDMLIKGNISSDYEIYVYDDKKGEGHKLEKVKSDTGTKIIFMEV